jgi:hypothetical protein
MFPDPGRSELSKSVVGTLQQFFVYLCSNWLGVIYITLVLG